MFLAQKSQTGAPGPADSASCKLENIQSSLSYNGNMEGRLMFFAIAFHLAGSRGLQKLQIAPLIKKEIDKMQHVLVYFFFKCFLYSVFHCLSYRRDGFENKGMCL